MLTPLEVLDRYLQAIREKSPDDLANLYAVDAVHELPFAHSAAGVLRGREAVREAYRGNWAAAPITVRSIKNVRVHACADLEVIVAEQDIELTNTMTGQDFLVAAVQILRVHNGEITHVRDYTDNLTIATALGRNPKVGS
jgi:ketosteroid isomerase-like protein